MSYDYIEESIEKGANQEFYQCVVGRVFTGDRCNIYDPDLLKEPLMLYLLERGVLMKNGSNGHVKFTHSLLEDYVAAR